MAADAGIPSGGALALTRGERRTVALVFAAIGVATAGGFAASYTIGVRWGLGAGLGVLAYVLGLRHGFDADHIAAIDNTTRRLLNAGQRPLTVGTWFSLGHSSVVGAMIVALVVATEAIQSRIASFQTVGALLGTTVSGVFLILIGALNLVLVVEVYRSFRAAQRGALNEREHEEALGKRGFLNRYFGRLFDRVTRPWKIYPIGVLFGLGFDTASEVTLIALSVGVGVSGTVPLWTTLVLPLLFACGMVLSDTSDGVSMRYAYGWAAAHPVRRVFYNLTLTVLSVLVAFAIAGVELLQVVASELGLSGPFWGGLASLNFETLGLLVAGLFVGSWGVALLVYRWKGYERAPSAAAPRSGGEGDPPAPATEP